MQTLGRNALWIMWEMGRYEGKDQHASCTSPATVSFCISKHRRDIEKGLAERWPSRQKPPPRLTPCGLKSHVEASIFSVDRQVVSLMENISDWLVLEEESWEDEVKRTKASYSWPGD